MSTRRPKVLPPLVLVVEDHEDTRALYEATLIDGGYRVETAATGDAAVLAAQRAVPSIILMDLAMPIVDGWTAVETLKGDATTKEAWIIAVTARSERHDLDRAYAAGCDAVALKPLEPATLLQLVASALKRQRASRREA